MWAHCACGGGAGRWRIGRLCGSGWVRGRCGRRPGLEMLGELARRRRRVRDEERPDVLVVLWVREEAVLASGSASGERDLAGRGKSGLGDRSPRDLARRGSHLVSRSRQGLVEVRPRPLGV
jgi:hypothetical protein